MAVLPWQLAPDACIAPILPAIYRSIEDRRPQAPHSALNRTAGVHLGQTELGLSDTLRPVRDQRCRHVEDRAGHGYVASVTAARGPLDSASRSAEAYNNVACSE